MRTILIAVFALTVESVHASVPGAPKIKSECMVKNNSAGVFFFFLPFESRLIQSQEQKKEEARMDALNSKLNPDDVKSPRRETFLSVYDVTCNLKTRKCLGERLKLDHLSVGEPLDQWDLVSMRDMELAFLNQSTAILRWGVYTFHVDRENGAVRLETDGGTTGDERATALCPS